MANDARLSHYTDPGRVVMNSLEDEVSVEESQHGRPRYAVPEPILRYAASARFTLAEEDEALFKSHGVYTQRPPQDGFFMVRVRVSGGELTSPQLRVIASLSEEYGRGIADVTVRQNIQLHWVRIESLPAIFETLNRAGLAAADSSGETVRNIMSCPVSGVDSGELYDASSLIRQAGLFFSENSDLSGLPRKLKIAISGCALRCVYPEVNDIGLFAVRDQDRSVKFRARVGGGLSTSPRFSKDLGVLVEPEQVVPFLASIARVFRDRSEQEGKRSRVKFQVEASEIPRFRESVEHELGSRLRRAADPAAPPVMARDRSHLGVHRQRGDSLYFIGIALVGGRSSSGQLKLLADLADQHGRGRLRTTNTQNIILLDIGDEELDSVKRKLRSAELDYEPSWARKGLIACTGSQFCKLAITETKNRARELEEHLSAGIDPGDLPRISVTGCPNACGQHRICDIGLEGSVTSIDGVKRESFQVFVGGGVGEKETLSRNIGIRIPANELAESLACLFARYRELRVGGETFQDFCLRTSDNALVRYLTSRVDQGFRPIEGAALARADSADKSGFAL
jgi:sulfite reductase (ferredoxin)